MAAMFVSPDFQGKGIGQQLMKKAKSLRNKLVLAVYQENFKGIEFYRKSGFVISKERVDVHTGHVEVLMEYSSLGKKSYKHRCPERLTSLWAVVKISN